NVRIWFPLERQSQCITTVEVLDSAGRVVRTLFNDMLPFGYYNFYWDKRDDSGRYVPEGDYVSRVTDACGGVRETGIRASYRAWERACLYYPPAGDSLPVIGFELTRDSVPVTLDMLRGPTNRVVIIEDSLMNRGRYVFDMRADSTIGSGQYLVRLRTGEYVRAVSIRYRR
ncbi:MAG: hypothetical protein OEW00_14580, partial [candidate division Zixibacteria bacterium]|nr:hypothetical protein [candidate division Zixibacteria bacterium]